MPQVNKNALFYETIHTFLQKKSRPQSGLLYGRWLNIIGCLLLILLGDSKLVQQEFYHYLTVL